MLTSNQSTLPRSQILALTAEIPANAGSGGQVRAFHCLEAVAGHADLTIALLTPVSEQLRNALPPWASIIESAAEGAPDKRNSIGTRLTAFAMPWREHGRWIMLTGQNICGDRSGQPGFSLMHWIYGLLLTVIACLLRVFCSPDPPDLHIRGPASDSLLETLRGRSKTVAYEIIWAEHSYLYPLAERCSQIFPGSRIIVNAHNIEFELKRSQASGRADWLGRIWLHENSRLYHQIETRMVRRADSVLCCSEADATRIRDAQSARAAILVVPNGIDTDHFRRSSATPDPNRLLFTGTAGYAPNDDAVRWLLTDVFPAVRKGCPQAELVLAGRNADRNWGTLVEDGARVQIVCGPADMRPLLQNAMVAIVPLRQGSGTRFKILEAMSMGLPVVSTSLGAEGLPVTHGENILIADTSNELAASVQLLFGNNLVRQKLSEAARQLVTETLDWRGIKHKMIESLQPLGLLQSSRQRGIPC